MDSIFQAVFPGRIGSWLHKAGRAFSLDEQPLRRFTGVQVNLLPRRSLRLKDPFGLAM